MKGKNQTAAPPSERAKGKREFLYPLWGLPMNLTPPPRLPMLQRTMYNLVKLPGRSIESLARRLHPAFKIQQAADRFVHEQMEDGLYQRLCAIPANTSDRKCRLLFYLAMTAKADGCLVEIGAFKGKSTAWLAEAARRTGKPLVSIDPHLLESLDEFNQTVQQFNIDAVATLHKKLSHDVGQNWPDPIAFLWIDGGHEYDCVRQDILDFAPHVQPGGIVVFDDVDPKVFPGVVQAVDELMHPNPSFKFLGQIKSFGLFKKISDPHHD